MIYLKKFKTVNEYNEFVQTEYYIKPNTSLIRSTPAERIMRYSVEPSLKNAVITCDDKTYNGETQVATNIVVTVNDVALVNNVDYIIQDNLGGINVGTYSFNVVGINDYRNSDTREGSFTINKVTPTVVSPTPKVLTYNGSSQVLANAGSTDFGTLKYSLSIGGTYTTDIPSATNANVPYDVYYKVDGDENINSVQPAYITCSIAEKRVTNPTIELSQTTYQYDGTAHEPTPTVKDGSTVIPTSEYSVTYLNNTNAGTATVVIDDAYDGNYFISGTTGFTISKIAPTYTAPTAVTGLTYNELARELVNAGSTSDGTIRYSLDNTNWATIIPQATSADTYTVYWKLDGDANHTDVASSNISVTIAKANPTYTAPTATIGLEYNGSAQNLILTGTTSDGTIKYSTDNTNWSTSVPQGTNAGSYTVYWKLEGNANHTDVASTSISCIIAKATGSVTTAPTGKTLDATGSAQALVTAGSSDTGTMMYSLDNSNWSSSIPTATDADTYTVYYKAAESANYTESSVGSVTTTIVLPDGVYAVTTAGKEVPLSQVNTSNPSGYVGVSVKYTQGTNMHFFIDKRFPTGSAAATGVGNYKTWSAALYKKDQSYLTNIGTSSGDGNSIASAAPEATRTAALNAYNNGETGVANTNNICNDSDCASETAQNNAAKYCRSIANPVTGAYNGYLGSLAEWIVVNDNQVEINQVLTAIGGVTFSVTASGSATFTLYWTSSESSSNYAWFWRWGISASFANFSTTTKSNSLQSVCSRPFFPL